MPRKKAPQERLRDVARFFGLNSSGSKAALAANLDGFFTTVKLQSSSVSSLRKLASVMGVPNSNVKISNLSSGQLVVQAAWKSLLSEVSTWVAIFFPLLQLDLYIMSICTCCPYFAARTRISAGQRGDTG
jgi:hypothetical protein